VKQGLLILMLYFYCSPALLAQTTQLYPEQDPCGALNICTNTLSVPGGYEWHSSALASTPCQVLNVVWLKMKVAVAGTLTFIIHLNDPGDGYSFTILNGTGKSCSQLSCGDIIRKNGNVVSGNLYLSSQSNPLTMPIQANAGDEYYIAVDGGGFGTTAGPPNVYYPASGFTIDFTGSTALLYSENPPMLDSVEARCNTRSRIYLQLSKHVKCSSIAEDGSDFEVYPNGSIYTVRGDNCQQLPNGYTDRLEIIFNDNITPPGLYEIRAKTGTDGNTVVDMCEQQLPLPQSIWFDIPVLNSSLDRIICTGQIPYTWNGITVPAPGDSVAAYTSDNYIGCDSTTVLNLSVTDTMKDTVDLFICPDMLPYSWNGITVNTTGNNVAVYYTAASGGCDSATYLNLHGIQPQNQTLNISDCGSVDMEGTIYYVSQTIYDTVYSIYGCDSLYRTINITIHPEIIPQSKDTLVAGCGFVNFRDVIYTADTTITDTIPNQYGCDSIYLANQIVVRPNVQPIEVYDTIKACRYFKFNEVVYDRDTVVVRLFKNIAGCDSLRHTTTIKIDELGLELIADPEQPVIGDILRLTATAITDPFTVVAWLPESHFPQQHLQEQAVVIYENTVYQVIGSTERGCLDTATVELVVEPLIPEVKMPNAFSPNNDGINDLFGPIFANVSGHTIHSFRVFNRWGELVYSDFKTRNPAWNGRDGNTGKDLPVGNYQYIIDISFVNGKKVLLKGDVTLIR